MITTEGSINFFDDYYNEQSNNMNNNHCVYMITIDCIIKFFDDYYNEQSNNTTIKRCRLNAANVSVATVLFLMPFLRHTVNRSLYLHCRASLMALHSFNRNQHRRRFFLRFPVRCQRSK